MKTDKRSDSPVKTRGALNNYPNAKQRARGYDQGHWQLQTRVKYANLS